MLVNRLLHCWSVERALFTSTASLTTTMRPVSFSGAMPKKLPPQPFTPPPGGVFSRREWHESGNTRRSLESLVRDGSVQRPAPGWYAITGASQRAIQAVRLRARLTCLSALSVSGVWTPPDENLHARIATGARGVTSSRNGDGEPTVLWHRSVRGRGEALALRAVDDVSVSLSCALTCLPTRDLVIVADSAIQLGKVDHSSLMALADGQPAHARKKLDFVDGSSQSGTESIVRLWCQLRGFTPRPQMWISGVGFVDLVVGERLVIECDSRAFHADEDRYRADRERDLVLKALGYRVLRLTYEQIMHRWPEVEGALLALLASGAHLASGSRRRRA
ncbi:hypothetical protein C5E07_10595 [Pseudoclavibacter sp. RFBJ3]|nr:hypothetical protein C5C12_09675 [Pseudoclavibacter sp. RFBJ5]PPF92201.1 hypothetical protein C5E07_10595 [Pseudoclavibacter sp. RFBJ3]PPF97064.1 hypothetical protein C5C19_13905 [Pseudoclavibacter sp. RFBH5]PPG23751.1 hypothetical protein C5E13_09290 [Pseudoclavibacter sp. RFBI4]